MPTNRVNDDVCWLLVDCQDPSRTATAMACAQRQGMHQVQRHALVGQLTHHQKDTLCIELEDLLDNTNPQAQPTDSVYLVVVRPQDAERMEKMGQGFDNSLLKQL